MKSACIREESLRESSLYQAGVYIKGPVRKYRGGGWKILNQENIIFSNPPCEFAIIFHGPPFRLRAKNNDPPLF